jgi:two-component system osmolarity sensor histidine kinase EnvZ
LGRNIGLLVGVILTGQVVAGVLVVALVLRPQTIRVADISARMLNVVSMVMDGLDPGEQARIVREISMNGDIHLRPATDPPDARSPVWPNFLERLYMRALAERLSFQDALAWRTDSGRHLWLQVALGGSNWWINISPPRPAAPMTSLVIAMVVAFAVALGGGLLLQRRLDRPLRALARSVAAFQPGFTPARIAIDGPTEIAVVAQALNDMADRIAAHESERALMLAGVSHDLRTPLARLRLSVEMMPHDDEELRQGAHRQIEQIDQMLGQFLDYVRDASEEQPRRVRIDTLVREAAHDAGVAEHLLIDVECGLAVDLRAFAVRRALKNLLENAARYGAPPISVRSRSAAGALVLDVIDHGGGFDPAMAEHLTRPFTREDGARSKPGTGLGLAIVRRLIEGEGGYLQFAHEGHRFVATLRIPRRDNGRAGTATGRR